MKHIRYQFLALLSVSALTFTSCDLIGSIDDMEPDYVVTDLNYITDATSAQTALNGVYASWRSTGVSYLRYGIASMAHTQTQAMVMGVDEFAAENIQTNNSNVETAYTAYYNVINTANTFLVHINKQIPGMTEEKRTEMIAEARCQRALAYLTLLKCFGEYWKQDSQYGVCLFKDELVRDNQVRQRSSVAETYKLISEDLDYAIAHCEQHPADHYHMSSLFAKALKAKMYFAQDNYPEAARLSEEVINEAEAAGYELESDYANIFTEQFNSKEMLFAPYTANPNELMDASWFAFSPGSLLKKVADDLVPDDETGGDIVVPDPGEEIIAQTTIDRIKTTLGISLGWFIDGGCRTGIVQYIIVRETTISLVVFLAPIPVGTITSHHVKTMSFGKRELVVSTEIDRSIGVAIVALSQG
jgi:starch-binding outer membrane protein, SusD/RagB family